VISVAGATAANVVGLVYVAAFALDEGEAFVGCPRDACVRRGDDAGQAELTRLDEPPEMGLLDDLRVAHRAEQQQYRSRDSTRLHTKPPPTFASICFASTASASGPGKARAANSTESTPADGMFEPLARVSQPRLRSRW
jgi:hypothetical protein